MVSGLLLHGLIAGNLGGLLAAGLSFLAGEPSFERAIAFESAMVQVAMQPPTPEIVSRSVQRGAGLLPASIVCGAAIEGLPSLVFVFDYGRSNGLDPKALSALLAFAGFVAMALVPKLKYPANPPAIGARTALYFAMLAISLLVMILAATIAPLSRWRAWRPLRCPLSMKFQSISRRASSGIFAWRRLAHARSCGLRSG